MPVIRRSVPVRLKPERKSKQEFGSSSSRTSSPVDLARDTGTSARPLSVVSRFFVWRAARRKSLRASVDSGRDNPKKSLCSDEERTPAGGQTQKHSFALSPTPSAAGPTCQPVGPHPRRAPSSLAECAHTQIKDTLGPSFTSWAAFSFSQLDMRLRRLFYRRRYTPTRLSFNFKRGQARPGFLVSLSFTFTFTLDFC